MGGRAFGSHGIQRLALLKYSCHEERGHDRVALQRRVDKKKIKKGKVMNLAGVVVVDVETTIGFKELHYWLMDHSAATGLEAPGQLRLTSNCAWSREAQ